MSSVNSTIEWMTRRGTLSSIVLAYVYAGLLVAGPWIFTVIGITGLSGMNCTGECNQLPLFRSIVIYNSMFALVVTSPIAFLSGRYVSGELFRGRTNGVFFALTASLAMFCLITVATAAPFYMFATTLSAPAQFAAVQNAFLIGVSWLLLPFLRVITGHNVVLLAFGANAAAMIVLGQILAQPSAELLLACFNAAFTLTNAILIGTLVRRFGTCLQVDRASLTYSPWQWELPAAGLAYAVGIWADKVIMWLCAPSGGLIVAGALKTMPAYDTAMFWAQLASIPVVAVAFVHVETRFSKLFHRFYGRLEHQASRRELVSAIERLRAFVISNVAGLFVALSIVATMMMLLSFVFMHDLGLRPTYMGILRASLLAMAFHASAMFCFLFLMYFDLRRQALLIVGLYAMLNIILTFAFLPLGETMYGFGNMIAAAATFVAAFTVLLRELPWLHYHAFITNNTSI